MGTNARTPLSPAPPLAPSAQPGLTPGRIDKSVLAIAEPKRLRDKAHLKFVASQPCLVVAGNQATHIICASPNREPLASRSATNSPFPSAGAITGNYTKPATRYPGGKTSKSNRSRSPSNFGTNPSAVCGLTDRGTRGGVAGKRN